eukprot:COSAG02_NODE_4253_length_5584_cov_251.164995_2_plen_579_part_00
MAAPQTGAETGYTFNGGTMVTLRRALVSGAFRAECEAAQSGLTASSALLSFAGLSHERLGGDAVVSANADIVSVIGERCAAALRPPPYAAARRQDDKHVAYAVGHFGWGAEVKAAQSWHEVARLLTRGSSFSVTTTTSRGCLMLWRSTGLDKSFFGLPLGDAMIQEAVWRATLTTPEPAQLRHAVITQDAMRVASLLRRGADPNGVFGGWWVDIQRNEDDWSRWILEERAGLLANPNGETILHVAASTGASDTSIVDMLLEAGADVKAKDKRGRTAALSRSLLNQQQAAPEPEDQPTSAVDAEPGAKKPLTKAVMIQEGKPPQPRHTTHKKKVGDGSSKPRRRRWLGLALGPGGSGLYPFQDELVAAQARMAFAALAHPRLAPSVMVVNTDVLDVVGQRLGVVLHRDAISLRWHVGRVPLAVLQSVDWEETARGEYCRGKQLQQVMTSLTNVPSDTGRSGWGIGYQSLATADTAKDLLIKLAPCAGGCALARTDLPMRVGSQNAAFFIEFTVMSRLHHFSIGVAQAGATQPLSVVNDPSARMFGEGFWCVTRDDGNHSGFVPRFQTQKTRWDIHNNYA